MNNHNSRTKKEDRKYFVLRHVVYEYVSTALPVSSKIVAERMGGAISSATIRNIMADLEDEGYIEQPHTSAGRVPTHSGYRHYVDVVKDRIRFEKREAQRLATGYNRRISTVKEIIEKTSFLISRELHNAGIVMWPSIEDFYLKRVELVKVRAETILAVLITMTNDVRNHIVKLDRDLAKTELEHITNYINTNYESSTFSFISEDLRHTLSDPREGENGEILETAKVALQVIDTIMDENIENEIYWEGLNYIMEKSEFHDPDLTRRIIQVFSDKRDLIRLMRKDLSHKGLKIYIGEENTSRMLRDCSLITCGYALHGRTAGRIGVIGPTRMDYDGAMRTVRCLSDLISIKLEEINA